MSVHKIIINYYSYTGVLRQVQGQEYIPSIKGGKTIKFNFHVSLVQNYFGKSIVLNSLKVKIKLKIVVPPFFKRYFSLWTISKHSL